MSNSPWIIPNWPVHSRVRALSTTRQGGVSQGPYASMNIGNHVDDNDSAIADNRAIFRKQLPAEPEWLSQVHGDTVVNLTQSSHREADASYTKQPNQVAVIMTADCLPILITDVNATVVAAIHGGWRSLAKGIIQKTIQELNTPSPQLLAWLGPAIGPKHFQVGDDVRAAFPDCPHAFVPDGAKWRADIFAIARHQLNHLGVTAIYGGDHCTYSEPDRFYSHRRDAGITGRMATAIWLTL
jgi:polyphenol oxidase